MTAEAFLQADASGIFADLVTDSRASGPLRAGISLRSAGDMVRPAHGNSPAREALYRSLCIDSRNVVTLKQIHSKTVHCIRKTHCSFPSEGDGLVTDNPALVLGVTVADCLPVYIGTADGACFGIVHSGWKGTGIAGEAVRLMVKEFGVDAASLSAALGPCIHSCCYNIPEDRAELFSGLFGSGAVRSRNGIFFLDLVEANIAVLESSGVRNIHTVHTCTSCDQALGSFRREGADSFTRMLALIGRF